MISCSKEYAKSVMKKLAKHYKVRKTWLNHKNPVQLLVSTILSAQCTDARVNMVTAELFKKYETAKDFASARKSTFEKEIYSTGFYRNKAKNIIAACKMIVKDYKGKVPDSMEELLKLPGVARKTANIVLSNAYGINDGMAVDTHVKRVSFRLGLTDQKDPNKIEKDLMQLYPKKNWDKVSLRLIAHGRALCKAPTPNCGDCFLNDVCPSSTVK